MGFKSHQQHRLPGRDYSRAGIYFVTICTRDRVYYFGEIMDDKMKLSEIGEIAKMFWLEIPNRYENVKLDAWVIMPNHVHGILVVGSNNLDRMNIGPNNLSRINIGPRDAPRRVPTHINPGRGLIIEGPELGIHPLVKGSVSSVINHFKGNVTKFCHKNNLTFAWQSRFHDRILRNEKSLYVVQRYIVCNPERWGKDRERSLQKGGTKD